MRFMVFCDRVGEVLSAADLVLSRAGAGTIAELIRCETPAVLVPFPQAADDHQRANAAYFERQGGGVVIDQTGMNTVATEVTKLIFSDELLTKFRANLRRMELANPLEFMLSDLEQIAGSKRRGVA
jgi:UDP-N-acetylglucosamine--N-acetylmuramyl-(pentapeptide) pyrophosphoryl-undecaprenol N-acetylglucosamine transferase